ncbi:MAG: sensor histidine kinase [Streptosporangiaceae bacterium]|jgi:signal transduction histidine kinase
MQVERIVGIALGAGAAVELLLRLVTEPGEAARLGVGGPAAVPTALVLILLCLLTTTPLLSKRWAASALTIDLACVVSLTVFGWLPVTGGCALLIASYLAGRHGPAWIAAGLGAPFLVVALAARSWPAVLLAGLIPVVALAGSARRASGSARLADAARSLSEGALTENMARGERARIARELHDVVAHHISMISVQAETARLTTPGLTALGEKRFAEIGETARTGLTEMRRLLGVLRPDADAVADRQPQPGLAQLTELIDTARSSSGSSVRMIVSGPVESLDPGVELAAFRIVQEALTNARRHAPGAAVDVELRFTGRDLRLRVRDNGPGPAADGSGHGLIGMRERAVAVGGSLTVGGVAGGGFRVEAVLPAKVLVS